MPSLLNSDVGRARSITLFQGSDDKQHACTMVDERGAARRGRYHIGAVALAPCTDRRDRYSGE